MDISVFFKFLSKENFVDEDGHNSLLGNTTSFFSGEMEELEGKRIAIIGVKEDRHSLKNTGCAEGPDAIRQKLYNLFSFDEKIEIIDLGNIEAGNEIKDTYYALNQTCQYLLRKNILPVILGGSQDLTFANYQAYEHLEQTVNLVTIDYRLDFGKTDEEANSKSYLNKIILHKPNYLFNYSNIGHQRYLTEPDLLELMSNMYFDTWRLGDMQPYLHRTEPIIRNADILSIDVASIRQSEAPGCIYAGPNGFYGDQAAQLCRYAGMSDKLSSVGFYEYNPTLDRDGQTAHLVAQMIWCMIEGMTHRKFDYPIGDYSEYFKYIVPMSEQGSEIVFYKSNKSDRWWMDVPYPSGQELKYERHHLVPCTYEEYQLATNEEMPDRWWKTYQKLV